MDDREKSVLEALDRLGIPFRRYEHTPVFTVEQAEVHWQVIAGAHGKNLFVLNQRGIDFGIVWPHNSNTKCYQFDNTYGD
jgi:hypothetical protein